MKNIFIILLLVCVNVLFSTELPFTLNGDVRVKHRYSWDIPKENHFKCEAKLGIEYQKENIWMKTKLKFSNPYETSEYTYPWLEIDQILMGYQFYCDDVSSFDMEIGRNKMENLFESKLCFDSNFNGVNLAYHHAMDYGSLYIHGGPHIIDSDLNHYGFIIETGLSNVMKTNLSLKYSLSHWNRHVPYLNSQILIRYDIPMGIVRTPSMMFYFEKLSLYAAYLNNHKANTSSQGFYIGLSLGCIERSHDLAIDLNYQNMESLAVPYFDCKGIGRGIELKTTYAVTDNFHIQAKAATTKFIELSAIHKW